MYYPSIIVPLFWLSHCTIHLHSVCVCVCMFVDFFSILFHKDVICFSISYFRFSEINSFSLLCLFLFSFDNYTDTHYSCTLDVTNHNFFFLFFGRYSFCFVLMKTVYLQIYYQILICNCMYITNFNLNLNEKFIEEISFFRKISNENFFLSKKEYIQLYSKCTSAKRTNRCDINHLI